MHLPQISKKNEAYQKQQLPKTIFTHPDQKQQKKKKQSKTTVPKEQTKKINKKPNKL